MRTPRIRRLRRRGDVAGLIDALGYQDLISLGSGQRGDSGVSVRMRALEALGELASPADVAGISAALQDNNPAVRQMAVRVIRVVDPELGASALATTVVGPGEQEFTEARLEALSALEELANRGQRRSASQIALAAVEGGPEVALDQVTRDALLGLVDGASKAEVSTLIDDLIDRLPAMNGLLDHAQVVLCWLAPHSVPPLIEALNRTGGFRSPAAAVLGAIGDSRAIEPLTSLLDDIQPDVRRVAVWALGELRDPRTVEALMRATMDDEYIVRCQAAEALDVMGTVALMAGVANMIRSLDDHRDGRAVARLVEEGLERTPASARASTKPSSQWAPRFVERLLRTNA